MMQARLSESDRRLYNPSRDIAHNFLQAAEAVAGRLEDHVWPELDALLEREGVTMDDLGEACDCYLKYLIQSKAEPTRSMKQSLQDSGWFACKDLAQIALLAHYGAYYAGVAFAGLREATLASEGPLMTVEDLTKSTEQLYQFLGTPHWKRWLMRQQSKLKRIFAR